MNKFIKDIIIERNLSSQLNNTKWKELISAITSKSDFYPDVNIKYLVDKENNGGFCPISWSEIEQEGFEYIEWFEIRTYKDEYVGRLIAPKRTYYTEFLTGCLETVGIHYFLENNVFRVNAYL